MSDDLNAKLDEVRDSVVSDARASDPTTAETPTMRYGFYVNGDLWAECSDENRAELIMDACAASFSDVASFDVMPLNETYD